MRIPLRMTFAPPPEVLRTGAPEAAFPAELRLFRPHLFFYRPWEGRGEITDARGRRIGGFTVSGEGRASSALGRIVQHWVFDNGAAHTAEWEVISASGRDYRARDVRSGATARGRAQGDRFLWVMRVKSPTPLGVRTVRVATAYRMIDEHTAEAETLTTVFGVIPIGRMKATYRRLRRG